MNAKVPVWYDNVIDSNHTTIINNPLQNTTAKNVPLKNQYLGATVA